MNTVISFSTWVGGAFWAIGGLMLLFYLTAFPLWALIEAIASSKLPGFWRVIWSGVVFCFWTLGGLIYAVFASGSQALKKTALCFLFVPVLLLMGFLIMPKNYQYQRFTRWMNLGPGQIRQENVRMFFTTQH